MSSEADLGGSDATAAAHMLEPSNISCSRGLVTWLATNQAALALSSYQTGRLYLVGVRPGGRVNFHQVLIGRAIEDALLHRRHLQSRGTAGLPEPFVKPASAWGQFQTNETFVLGQNGGYHAFDVLH